MKGFGSVPNSSTQNNHDTKFLQGFLELKRTIIDPNETKLATQVLLFNTSRDNSMHQRPSLEALSSTSSLYKVYESRRIKPSSIHVCAVLLK